MLPHAEKSHQAQRQGTSLTSQGTSMGLGWWGDTRLAGGPPAKEMPCPSVQCSITACPSPKEPHTLAAGISGHRGREPSPLPPRSPTAPPPRQHRQRLTPWRGRCGSSTGAAGRFAAEPERCWAASWLRLCGGLP